MRSALAAVLLRILSCLWFPSSRLGTRDLRSSCFGIPARREPRRSCVPKQELGNEGTESGHEDDDEDDDEDD